MSKPTFPPTGHTLLLGYLFWVFGFTGAHRFYYGKKWTGLIWFLTGGMLMVGWIIDLFLIPSMDEEAEIKFFSGPYNYNIAWLLLTFLGFLGIHRFYLGKVVSGFFFLITFGWLTIGWAYDFWNLNEMVSDSNRNYEINL